MANKDKQLAKTLTGDSKKDSMKKVSLDIFTLINVISIIVMVVLLWLSTDNYMVLAWTVAPALYVVCIVVNRFVK